MFAIHQKPSFIKTYWFLFLNLWYKLFQTPRVSALSCRPHQQSGSPSHPASWLLPSELTANSSWIFRRCCHGEFSPKPQFPFTGHDLHHINLLLCCLLKMVLKASFVTTCKEWTREVITKPPSLRRVITPTWHILAVFVNNSIRWFLSGSNTNVYWGCFMLISLLPILLWFEK